MKFKKPNFWDYQQISFWAILLLPISILYLATTKIIRIFSFFKNYRKLPIRIICVGNVYLGGTGKTPLAREIFKITKNFGKNPAFIKKYYDYLFDEIEMLKNTGKIYTCHKRQKGLDLCSLDNHDIAILDDGFQDTSIRPHFSILCFNSKQMVGNGLVIPSGPLRESLDSILRANCIIINGNKNFEFEKKLLKKIGNKKIPIFYAKYKIKNIEKFKNKEITAFAGIGNPSNFFSLLRENNLNIKETYSFPDHHNYSKEDFDKITKNKSNIIATTEKDYYRITDNQKKNCHYVEADYEIENIEKFKEIINSKL
tara:strand:+ start:621 stop:1556 length:936 start_codon:yes stop_codon:yes gene_type:complete